MHDTRDKWTDQRIEILISDLLRTGVVLAAVVTLFGGVLYLVHAGSARPEYKVFHGEPTDLQTIRGVLTNAFSGNSSGIIQLGLLLLIATPVARVAFSGFAFAIQRDKLYVFVTLVVLGVITLGLA